MDSTPYALKVMTRASFGDVSNRAKFENDLLISTLNWMNVSDLKRVNTHFYPTDFNTLVIRFIPYLKFLV